MAPDSEDEVTPPAVKPETTPSTIETVKSVVEPPSSLPPLPPFDPSSDPELYSAVSLPPYLASAIASSLSKIGLNLKIADAHIGNGKTEQSSDINAANDPPTDAGDAADDTVHLAADTEGGAEESTENAMDNVESVPKSVILVFVNSRSGGRLGSRLEELLRTLVGPTQVYDLSLKSPGKVLQAVVACLRERADKGDVAADLALSKLRVLVAGGDGTAGWLMSTLKSENLSSVPIAVVPLGTGNDLARSFGWGPSAPPMRLPPLRKRILMAANNPVKMLDSWRILVVPASNVGPALALPHAMLPHQHRPGGNTGKLEEASEEGEKEVELSPAFQGTFYNYFSLGMDAQITYGFHRLRETKPWLARGRLANQMIYSSFGCGQGWFCTGCSVKPHRRSVSHVATVYVKKEREGDWVELFVPDEIRALIVLNLQSYAGGRNIWGKATPEEEEEKGWEEPGVDDGRVEVVGLRGGWHTMVVMGGLSHAVRLAQAYGVRMELRGRERGEAYMQLDGEPWQQPLSEREETQVEISFLSQCSVVAGKEGLMEEDTKEEREEERKE